MLAKCGFLFIHRKPDCNFRSASIPNILRKKQASSDFLYWLPLVHCCLTPFFSPWYTVCEVHQKASHFVRNLISDKVFEPSNILVLIIKPITLLMLVCSSLSFWNIVSAFQIYCLRLRYCLIYHWYHMVCVRLQLTKANIRSSKRWSQPSLLSSSSRWSSAGWASSTSVRFDVLCINWHWLKFIC